MTAKELQKELTWEFPDVAKAAPDQVKEAYDFAEGYKDFLGKAKTEREFTEESVKLLDEAGYRPIEKGKTYQPGDKVYYVNRGKSLIMTTFGKKPMEEGLRLNAAHIDSPRLDLKAQPLFEKDGIAYFKPHYYGGIRKYQWVTVPLAMHGVFVKKDGSVIKLNVGEEPGDPMFLITDLLPHLGAKQNGKKLTEAITGEDLNIVVGSLPFVDDSDDKIKEPVKLKALELLHEKYGVTERDFLRAEIEFVPAAKPVDIGFDRSMIGGYGQDDKVCAYPALIAEIEAKDPEYTTVTVLTDKEEIGSEGNTGLNSDYMLHYIEDLAAAYRADVREVLRNSICLSSDVGAAFDPTFPQVFEKNNSAFLGKGVSLIKYTGSRGKSGSNDASAELMNRIMNILDDHNVMWQAGELGKVDEGGGGTVAKFVAGKDINVVDLGVPVLCMHSPFELTSKMDVYSAYLAYKAFYD
ncbi:Aspartyl aminopeptidase [[Clostridium] aminophilum]|uniref:M18 family aminopeptidase n=1 Tax=[Clostridium] aminophilum TaxID=1526 RepID=A0A1I0DFY5_9FIRM|nr:aminopeptidase [[Clostridium] aminophilum]SET31104.1 Aspartyl aminopeptidase [[Clostridium] aminophilum]